ncbi:MAG: cohesin domain-containing protein [Acidobacteria bacterium]|nr:cohesin domain-containing protein [Acidobacteriota bacterium]
MRGLFRRLAVVMVLLLVTIPAAADKAKSFYKQGKDAETRQNYEAAFDAYRQAYDLKPREVRYRLAMQRARFLAAATIVNKGQLLREAGKLAEALAEFERAAAMDPSNFMAQQEVRRTRMLMDQQAKPEPPAPISSLSKRVEEAQGPVDLAPISEVPITLKLTEDTKVIYMTIGKLAGVNVLFDPDYVSRRIPIELNGVTLNQALEILALQSKTFWRPVTSNTIFVAADTTAKRKELEQNVIRTFYLSNLSAPTELQDVVNTLRQILELARVQQLPSQGAVVVRGTPDQVALAEKLINDIDKAKPEVIVEVAVMQVRRDKLRDLGISPPTSTSIQVQGTTTSTGTGGTTTTTGTPGTINLNRLANLDAKDFIITIPAATANFLFTDSTSKIIQNPMIRALDGQKASLKIGDRVPVATGSFQPGIGGVGINPLVNTQFQYIDVGVNIDITPKVHAGREITLKLMLDISAVTSRVNIGGIDQPVIGQRKIEHEIRLKEGEVNLMGGILEEQDVKSLRGIPGLGQIPILKYLFADERVERAENEIMFALVPRIVRSQELTDLNLRALSVGTGAGIDLRRASTPQGNALPPASQPKGGAAPGNGAAAPPPAATTQPAPAAPSEVRLGFDPAAISQPVGGSFVVNVTLAGAQNVHSVTTQVTYDPAALQLVNISNGGFLSRDGQAVALVHRDDPSSGTLQMTATRPPGSGGSSGDGNVFTLTFVARAPGQSSLGIARPSARDASLNPVPAGASGAVAVTIK